MPERALFVTQLQDGKQGFPSCRAGMRVEGGEGGGGGGKKSFGVF